MAWTAPRTWVAGEIVTAALMNAHVRDNTRYLKGLDGVPTIESGLTIDNTDGDERLLLPLLSTAECTSVLNAEGEVAFDEQTHRIKYYDNNSVVSVVGTDDVSSTPTDSATTTPISSDWAYDHLNILTTAGDILYATGARVWARLGIGTAGQRLRTNAGATAPEWAATGQTQQFHIPAFAGTGTLPGAAMAGVILDAGAETAIMTSRVPDDFTVLTSVNVLIDPVTTGNFDWTAATVFGANGEAYNTHTDSTTADAQGVTDRQLLELDISAAFTGLAAGDIFTLTFTLDALDTTANLRIYGIDFKYT